MEGSEQRLKKNTEDMIYESMHITILLWLLIIANKISFESVKQWNWMKISYLI